MIMLDIYCSHNFSYGASLYTSIFIQLNEYNIMWLHLEYSLSSDAYYQLRLHGEVVCSELIVSIMLYFCMIYYDLL